MLGPVLSCDELFTERIRIKGGTLFFGIAPANVEKREAALLALSR
jgi:hypothetical protein